MVYPGGKGAVYQKLINLMPPHRTYIETHLGGGSVMKAKRPAALNIGIDINPIVLAQTASEIQPGAIVVSGDTAGTIARNGEGISRFSFMVADVLDFLKAYQFRGDEMVYADPPYVRETRRTKADIYQFEYDDNDHVNLLSVLLNLPCAVMISGYWSELYADLLVGWHTISFMANTRGGVQAEEWLWMNYPEPTKLHDYTYLGDSFRERERIKRKKSRWLNRLKGMDKLERQAIMWAIAEAGLDGDRLAITDDTSGAIAISSDTVPHRQNQRCDIASSEMVVGAHGLVGIARYSDGAPSSLIAMPADIVSYDDIDDIAMNSEAVTAS